MITYRTITGPTATEEEWDAIETILARRGWMSLCRLTTPAIVLAENDGHIIGFFVLQLVPHLEPMYITPKYRGEEIPDELISRMHQVLQAANARGWIVVADNPIVEKMCRDHGMIEVDSPVFASLPSTEVN